MDTMAYYSPRSSLSSYDSAYESHSGSNSGSYDRNYGTRSSDRADRDNYPSYDPDSYRSYDRGSFGSREREPNSTFDRDSYRDSYRSYEREPNPAFGRDSYKSYHPNSSYPSRPSDSIYQPSGRSRNKYGAPILKQIDTEPFSSLVSSSSSSGSGSGSCYRSSSVHGPNRIAKDNSSGTRGGLCWHCDDFTYNKAFSSSVQNNKFVCTECYGNHGCWRPARTPSWETR